MNSTFRFAAGTDCCSCAVLDDTFARALNNHQYLTTDATGGTFALAFDGETTTPLAHDASANDVRQALKNLSTITDYAVAVYKLNNNFHVQFTTPHDTTTTQIVADTSNLDGTITVDVGNRWTEVPCLGTGADCTETTDDLRMLSLSGTWTIRQDTCIPYTTEDFVLVGDPSSGDAVALHQQEVTGDPLRVTAQFCRSPGVSPLDLVRRVYFFCDADGSGPYVEYAIDHYFTKSEGHGTVGNIEYLDVPYVCPALRLCAADGTVLAEIAPEDGSYRYQLSDVTWSDGYTKPASTIPDYAREEFFRVCVWHEDDNPATPCFAEFSDADQLIIEVESPLRLPPFPIDRSALIAGAHHGVGCTGGKAYVTRFTVERPRGSDSGCDECSKWCRHVRYDDKPRYAKVNLHGFVDADGDLGDYVVTTDRCDCIAEHELCLDGTAQGCTWAHPTLGNLPFSPTYYTTWGYNVIPRSGLAMGIDSGGLTSLRLVVGHAPTDTQYVGPTHYLLTVEATNSVGTSTADVLVWFEGHSGLAFTNEPYSSTVTENAKVGTVIGQVTAASDDAPPKRLHYYINDWEEHWPFAVDATTGVVTVNNPEYVRRYTSTTAKIRVHDGFGRYDSTTVNITVTPAAPFVTFARDTYHFELPPNASLRSLVGSVGDVFQEGATLPLAYALSGGDGAFAIDGQTGAITLVDPTRFTGEATLSVQVHDAGTLSDTATVAITTAPTEKPPVFDDDFYEFTLDGKSPPCTAVGTVRAEGATSYAIIDGNPGDVFAIDAITGIITVNQLPQTGDWPYGYYYLIGGWGRCSTSCQWAAAWWTILGDQKPDLKNLGPVTLEFLDHGIPGETGSPGHSMAILSPSCDWTNAVMDVEFSDTCEPEPELYEKCAACAGDCQETPELVTITLEGLPDGVIRETKCDGNWVPAHYVWNEEYQQWVLVYGHWQGETLRVGTTYGTSALNGSYLAQRVDTCRWRFTPGSDIFVGRRVDHWREPYLADPSDGNSWVCPDEIESSGTDPEYWRLDYIELQVDYRDLCSAAGETLYCQDKWVRVQLTRGDSPSVHTATIDFRDCVTRCGGLIDTTREGAQPVAGDCDDCCYEVPCADWNNTELLYGGFGGTANGLGEDIFCNSYGYPYGICDVDDQGNEVPCDTTPVPNYEWQTKPQWVSPYPTGTNPLAKLTAIPRT